MRVLLDTNMLVRLKDKSDAQHQVARNALRNLKQLRCEPVVVPQCLYEFWTAATRSREANGLAISSEEAKSAIESILSRFQLLPDDADLTGRFIDLVARHNVTGTNAYDARLAAAMLTHGVTHLLTFNAKDFRRLGIEVIEP